MMKSRALRIAAPSFLVLLARCSSNTPADQVGMAPIDGGVDASSDASQGIDGANGGDDTSTPPDGALPNAPTLDPSRGDKYILAPPTRTLEPVAVFTTNGTVNNPKNVLSHQATEISGNGSYIVLDFGKEVGGIITLTFSAASDASQTATLAFSESSKYVGPASDQSNGTGTPDGALPIPFSSTGTTTYTVPHELLRGGFRYVTITVTSGGFVHLDKVSLDYSPDPNRAVPNQYPNYFYSNDDIINKAWYAGAYTFQTNLVRNHEGRAWPPVSDHWNNGQLVGESGTVVLTDAAKRDRTVWPGDMAISVPTGFASLCELDAVKNSLQTLYNHQGGDGGLPYAGPPMNFGGSDTYHMWTLFGTYLYFIYSNDKAWLDSIWGKYKLGVAFSTAKIDASGLFDDTLTNDWARDNPGGENIQANAILYGVLNWSAALAQIEGDSALSATYAAQAASLKAAINTNLWDSNGGAYKDNPSSALYPQDGNALAVWTGVVDDPVKARSISYVLAENWNDKGSRTPEFTFGTGTPRISTYAGSMELMSHFVSGYDARGLAMIRTMWGYMITSPSGTASTFWEGFDSAGNFAYQDSFTSAAHGWGTGPTSALTFYVLGLAPETGAGVAYHVLPQPGDLTHVEGRITMSPAHLVGVSYDVGPSCASFAMRVDSSTHAGSAGTIGLPKFGAKHTVRIDGTVAWDGSALVGAPAGIAAAHEDANYIYFTGVAPGNRVFVYDDGKSCPAPPEQWDFCADEGGHCTFTGTKRVRFGKRGQYKYGLYTGAVTCDSTTFGGDPIDNVLKSCELSNDLYTPCANEGGTCAFAGAKEVRFGANGQWVSRTLSDGTPCDAATFGDPIPNVVKRCEVR